MHKIFCFIFGISFASFGMERNHNRSYTAQSEVQEVINDCAQVYRTLKNRQNSDPQFREHNVLLVGGSGTGKDSLLYYFKKTPLKITDSGELEASAPLEGVCIGHSCSETIVPASVVVDGITYWSCPGFSDTRGSKQDFVNMLAINNILRGNIKIVIVIDEAGIQNDRHKEIFECVRKIKNNMLPNIANDLSQHLGLIVTRGEYQSSQNTIQDLLEEINNDNFNRDYKNDVVQIVKDLIEKRIAYFPETSSGEEVYPSNFRDDILQMIQEIPDYLKLGNDTVQMQFDDKVKSFLGDMHVALLAQTNDIIENHLFKSIKILLDNARSEIALLLDNARFAIILSRDHSEIIDADTFTHRITSLADKIKDIRIKMNAVDKNSKGHVLLDSIHNVFMDILHDNSHAVEHLQQIKRISTCIEFVCKYYDALFFIDKWITGLQGLNQELSDCENYIFDKRKEATIATGANIPPALLHVILFGAASVGLFAGTVAVGSAIMSTVFVSDAAYQELVIAATRANIAPPKVGDLLPDILPGLCAAGVALGSVIVGANVIVYPVLLTGVFTSDATCVAYTATKLAIGAAGIGVKIAIQKVNDAINPQIETDKNKAD